MILTPIKLRKRGKNRRLLELLQPGQGVILPNRVKAVSLCETARKNKIRVGTHILPDGTWVVYCKPLKKSRTVEILHLGNWTSIDV